MHSGKQIEFTFSLQIWYSLWTALFLQFSDFGWYFIKQPYSKLERLGFSSVEINRFFFKYSLLRYLHWNLNNAETDDSALKMIVVLHRHISSSQSRSFFFQIFAAAMISNLTSFRIMIFILDAKVSSSFRQKISFISTQNILIYTLQETSLSKLSKKYHWHPILTHMFSKITQK